MSPEFVVDVTNITNELSLIRELMNCENGRYNFTGKPQTMDNEYLIVKATVNLLKKLEIKYTLQL